MKTRSPGSISPGDKDMRRDSQSIKSVYPDDQLVLEALDDSDPAFGQLVKKYQYRVLRAIASIISDEQAAQDVAQETFLSAWSDLAKLKERERFGRWLNQIAINLSKNWLRDQRKHRENKVPLDENVVVLAQEIGYQRDRLRQQVWEAIDELSSDYREVIILHYISGYSYKEISEMLSIPFSTIVGRLQEARNQLRKEFLDMVTKLQLEIDSTVHKFLKEHAKQDGVSIEGLIIRLIERYRRNADTSGVITRQVWETALDIYAVSPDGRYVSYINWDKGNLAIHDFETGENRDVTDEGNWDKDYQYSDASIWSPDSKQLAYLWYKGSGTNLRIVGINGAKPRVLYSSPEEAVAADPHGYAIELSPRAWSRDGKHILALHHKKTDETHDHDFVLVSVADGSIRVLKSLDGHRLGNFGHRMSLSPDGRYVVYDSPQSDDSPNRDIFLLATDGSHEMALVEHPADDFAPFWAPDGSRIVFASDRSGSIGVWVLEMVNGNPKGSPQLISDKLNGMSPLGLTQHGSYHYGLQSRENDVYFADMDPETGKIVKPPTKAIQNFEGLNRQPDFSPDGKRLVYLSNRGAEGWRFSSFVIRSLETGEERELQLDPPLWLLGGSAPRWSPDGRSIIVLARVIDLAKKTRLSLSLHQINVETGAVTPVVWDDEQGGVARQTPPVWSPDGSKMFFFRRQGGIRIYDFDAEQERKLDFSLPVGAKGYVSGLDLSPDGQQLAFIVAFDDEYSLCIAPSAGGEMREVLRLPTAETPRYPDRKSWLVWTSDGRHLIFPRLKNDAIELWRSPIGGGDPQKLGLTMKKIEDLSVHPDGHRIAFTGPGPRSGYEVWAMENFLPTATSSR
ncbi:sigma-70 family RNA polymerase sigma factor [Candidatus Poribacteria bacterium]